MENYDKNKFLNPYNRGCYLILFQNCHLSQMPYIPQPFRFFEPPQLVSSLSELPPPVPTDPLPLTARKSLSISSLGTFISSLSCFVRVLVRSLMNGVMPILKRENPEIPLGIFCTLKQSFLRFYRKSMELDIVVHATKTTLFRKKTSGKWVK